MIQRFLNWLASFRRQSRQEPQSKKETSFVLLPAIEGKERLCRSVYSTINITDKGKLKPNTFRTPAGKDEVSVNRLDFTTPLFCKSVSKTNQNPPLRSYHGFAIIFHTEVLETDSKTIYSPITIEEQLNIFHSDITIGYIPKEGEELPCQFQKKVRDMTKKSRFYVDPDANSAEWKGDELK